MYSRRNFSILLILFFIISSSILVGIDDVKKSDWEIEDVLKLERAGGFDISPDGHRVVWVKSTPDKEKDRSVSHIFLSSLEKKSKPLQLTRGEDSARGAKWSPSGEKIAFLSSRKNKKDKDSSGMQLWLMDRRGGEPWKITSLESGVFACEWLDDGRILLVAREDKTLREQLKKERKDTAYIVEDQEHMIPHRLYILDIEKKKLKRLTENNDQIRRFYLSPDKNWVITRNRQSVRYGVDKKIKPKFFLINLKNRNSKEIFPDPKFKPSEMEWAYDSAGFYFTHKRTSDYVHDGPGAYFLYYYSLKSGDYKEVPLDWEWGLFYYGIKVREDGFVASLANGAIPKWRRYRQDGASYKYEELEGEHYPQVFGMEFLRGSDKVVYSYSTASEPTQWHLGELDGNRLEKRWKITDLNPHLEKKKMAAVEVIKWKGALDDEIEGVLYYPTDYEKGKKYPLMLMIHGGPTGIDMNVFRESWAAYPNLITGRGAFVLRVNYHGSTGYGQKFVESIKGHYYEYEIPDILSGIDKLVAEGKVDVDKLGTMGWSNGGILSIGLTTWTDRFKVAGIGAADVNWISDYGNCAFGVSFDDYYFKGPPWEELDHYIEKSPLFHLKDVKVPTIIFHGTKDTSVPYEQGWEYYRALQQIGNAPVRFVVFPSEPHGLQKITHQKRKMTEELEWFDRYLFKTHEEECEALRKGSPLDILIKKEEFARADGLYGIEFKDHLIPELVEKDDIKIGRFEVTRAQWASYKKDYKYPEGTGNYPVTDISFESARGYISWLNELTGKKYRLPAVKEAEKFSKMGGSEGNTLNYWAGYKLNYDDAKLLKEKIKEYKGSLLLPVDKRPAAGEKMIYGLAGNAAEWAVNSDNKGEIIGKSAVTYSDSRAEHDKPDMEYVGFRVYMDKK